MRQAGLTARAAVAQAPCAAAEDTGVPARRLSPRRRPLPLPTTECEGTAGGSIRGQLHRVHALAPNPQAGEQVGPRSVRMSVTMGRSTGRRHIPCLHTAGGR
jgi:hypothetical protein